MNFRFKYFPDPGIIIDVIKLISVKLNNKSYVNSPSTLRYADSDETLYLIDEAASFPEPPKELLLFFYKADSQSINFMTSYVTQLLEKNFTSFSLSSLQETISDFNSFAPELFTFYFGSADYYNTNYESTIRSNSTLPAEIKLYLLGFCVNCAAYLQPLFSTLKTYYVYISDHYLAQHPKFTPDPVTFQKLISHVYSNKSSLFFSRPIAYSYCIIMRKYLCINTSSSYSWFITGFQFDEIVSSITASSQVMNIEKVCAALGDPSRMQIIQYLLTHSNQTAKDFTSLLHLSPTSVHHHFNVLRDANLVLYHRKKSGVLYNINLPIFKEVSHYFQTFYEGGVLHEEMEKSDDHSTYIF